MTAMKTHAHTTQLHVQAVLAIITGFSSLNNIAKKRIKMRAVDFDIVYL